MWEIHYFYLGRGTFHKPTFWTAPSVTVKHRCQFSGNSWHSRKFFTPKKHPGFSGFLPLSKTKERNLKETDKSNSKNISCYVFLVIVNSECARHLRGILPLDLEGLCLRISSNQSRSRSFSMDSVFNTCLSPESGILTTALPVHWCDNDVGNRIVVKPWLPRESTWAH